MGSFNRNCIYKPYNFVCLMFMPHSLSRLCHLELGLGVCSGGGVGWQGSETLTRLDWLAK